MALIVPNKQDIIKRDPKLGDALTKIESYVNLNVAPAVGNKIAPPGFVQPGKPSG